MLCLLVSLAPGAAQRLATTQSGLIRAATVFSLGSILCGCLPSLTGGPTRIYTVDQEANAARSAISDLTTAYYTSSESSRTALRNEIIGERLYAIDVEFTQYDEELTKEAQEVGFAADATSQTLNIVGPLLAHPESTKILSGIAGGVTGLKGSYQSDIVVAKTIQIVQAQMQANRDTVLTQILERMSESTTTYPLSIAMTDLEDYYRAGTFTEGLIQTSSNVSQGAQAAQNIKNSVATLIYSANFSTDAATTALMKFLYPNGKLNPTNLKTLNDLLAKPPFPTVRGAPWTVSQILYGPGNANIRLQLAKAAGLL